MRKFFGTVFIVLLVMFFAGCLVTINGIMGEFKLQQTRLTQPSILFLELKGVIVDAEDFLKDLREYADREEIRGVLIQVNSPGGAVGPSQELYSEIRRIRDELKKPVVVSCLGMAASGGYYAAIAADKIVTNPGCLMGSIGVIMEFANLEDLYSWAKIKRYAIKTGPYKDSGAEYRPMREDEKNLFQEMANEVLAQFKKAVGDSRKLSPEIVDRYSDGRVFTGATAVSLGFADQIGSLIDATRLIGQLSGLGVDPEIYIPPRRRGDLLNELFIESRKKSSLQEAMNEFLGTELLGQPLFLMPGVRP